MYECVKSTMSVKDDEGKTQNAYGIIVKNKEDGKIVFSANDLTFNLKDIEEFILDWNTLQPDIVHFKELVEDFVGSNFF